MKNLTNSIYAIFEAKYLQYCDEYEPRMEEYYEDYISAHNERVLTPAVDRIEPIIKRLGYDVTDFWFEFNMNCTY